MDYEKHEQSNSSWVDHKHAENLPGAKIPASWPQMPRSSGLKTRVWVEGLKLPLLRQSTNKDSEEDHANTQGP
jgi:hypothetical protein